MRSNKVTQFVGQVQELLNNLNRDEVKLSIGDSIGNNRTLTVSQLLRFLRNSYQIKDRKLANTIEAVYNTEIVKEGLAFWRMEKNRKDSYDCNEFINTVDMVTVFSTHVRSLSQTISRAA